MPTAAPPTASLKVCAPTATMAAATAAASQDRQDREQQPDAARHAAARQAGE